MTIHSTVRSMPFAQQSALLTRLVQEKHERRRTNKIKFYEPYAKQAEFHAAGATYRERLLRAGNQLGKTFSGAAELSYHLTGRYPAWWVGRRWDRAVNWWVGGKDSISVRDSIGMLLLGPTNDRGTGLIPKDAIVDISPSRGVADGVDSVLVSHVGGETSRLTFKTYDQGRERWQAATLDGVWFDEEPSEDIYLEGLTRTNATGGMVFMTFTPLLGMSKVVKRFLNESSPDRHDTNMTIEDALHIPAEERDRIIASYPPHERNARTRGIPIFGSGLIFPVIPEDITVAPFAVPKHWPQIGAMDFGWNHPFAAVRLAYDRDGDIVYVTHVYRMKEQTPLDHVRTIRAWGDWLPWAWPHDGLQHSKDSGVPLANQYRANGLNMLGVHARFPDGSTGVEAGLFEILERMQTGRFKVFGQLNEWFEEFRQYHRKDGQVVKEGDDLMAATRYGVMMLRESLVDPKWFKAQRPAGRMSDPLGDYR